MLLYKRHSSFPFNDLREFIHRLEQEGELQTIEDEVQPVLEVGAIIRRAYDLRAPAPFFLNLRGYPGNRILGAPLGLSREKKRAFARFAIALGMRPESSALEITEEYIRRSAKTLKPVMVKDAPCKENIWVGDEIDLQAIPAPVLHREDGGPYLGTWHTNITKDPESGERHWGLSRLMLHHQKTMGGPFLPEQNIAAHYYANYESRGRPMEFAVAIGTEPVTPAVAGAPRRLNTPQAEIVGALRGAPLELVKCETVDLEVPATAEIVIEGFVPPRERREDGPFGEYGTFIASARTLRPVYHVTAITHRNDPILPVAVDDLAVSLCLTQAAHVLSETRRHGFPVRSVYCPPEALSQWTVVSTKALPYPGFARHLAQTVWKTASGYAGRYVVIVEEDIDPTDLGQVLRAISTMCHPKSGLIKIQNAPNRLPLSFPSAKKKTNDTGDYAFFDCTGPRGSHKETSPLKAPFDPTCPEDIREKVVRNWRSYGYQECLDE